MRHTYEFELDLGSLDNRLLLDTEVVKRNMAGHEWEEVWGTPVIDGVPIPALRALLRDHSLETTREDALPVPRDITGYHPSPHELRVVLTVTSTGVSTITHKGP
jgi:hypothetical protein